MLDVFGEYKALIGAIATTAVVSTFVAGGVASRVAGNALAMADEAKKKTEVQEKTSSDLAGALKAVAETQRSIREQQARLEGNIDGILAGLELAPEKLERLRKIPRQPELTEEGRIVCGQMWLDASRGADTLVLWTISLDSCKISGDLISPRQKKEATR